MNLTHTTESVHVETLNTLKWSVIISLLHIYIDGTKYRLSFRSDFEYKPEISDFEKVHSDAFKEAQKRNPLKILIYSTATLSIVNPNGEKEIKDNFFIHNLFLKGERISCH